MIFTVSVIVKNVHLNSKQQFKEINLIMTDCFQLEI